jgi:predicted nuclease with RNAse H fold
MERVRQIRPGAVHPDVRYVGVDLAWKEREGSDRTAIAVMDDRGSLVGLSRADTDRAIVDAVAEAGRPALVGVDAPLQVPNVTSNRPCERELIRAGVSVLPANRPYFDAWFGGCRGERLTAALGAEGYPLTDGHAIPAGGSAVVEVYPYTFWRTVFPTVPQYKKGRKAGRVEALVVMRDALLGLLPAPPGEGALRLMRLPASADCTRADLDRMGDALDAIAAAMTMWDLQVGLSGGARASRGVRLFGDLTDGYILASWPPLVAHARRK